MTVPATLEQILDYLRDDYEAVILQGQTTECLFTHYDMDNICSQLYEAEVIGIGIEGDYLALKLDDTYGNIDMLLENPWRS